MQEPLPAVALLAQTQKHPGPGAIVTDSANHEPRSYGEHCFGGIHRKAKPPLAPELRIVIREDDAAPRPGLAEPFEDTKALRAAAVEDKGCVRHPGLTPRTRAW